jgi:hypothetical protein
LARRHRGIAAHAQGFGCEQQPVKSISIHKIVLS